MSCYEFVRGFYILVISDPVQLSSEGTLEMVPPDHIGLLFSVLFPFSNLVKVGNKR